MQLIMEPLGIPTNMVVPSSLKRWSDTVPLHHLVDYEATGESPKHAISPFPFDPELNHKIIIWYVLRQTYSKHHWVSGQIMSDNLSQMLINLKQFKHSRFRQCSFKISHQSKHY